MRGTREDRSGEDLDIFEERSLMERIRREGAVKRFWEKEMVRALYHDGQEVPAVEEREINLLDNNFDQDEVYILTSLNVVLFTSLENISLLDEEPSMTLHCKDQNNI